MSGSPAGVAVRVGLLVLMLAAGASAQSFRLSAPLVPGGNVSTFEVAPDGRTVVYRADQDTDGVDELYGVRLPSGAGVKLSGPMVAGGNVDVFAVTPDSARVLYIADQDVDGRFELYSVPIGGGASVRLNAPLVTGGDVVQRRPTITPDGTRVVYQADQEVDERFELYSVPVLGGLPVRVHPLLGEGGSTSRYLLASDGEHVVFSARTQRGSPQQLFSASVLGGALSKLDNVAKARTTRPRDILAWEFASSANGERVVFLHGPEERQSLYSVPITGGTPTLLNPPLHAWANITRFELDPTGARVAYVADAEVDELFELYSVAIDGGTAVRLNGPLVAGGDVENQEASTFDTLLFTPDGTRVLYVADQDSNDHEALYVVPAGGGVPLALSLPDQRVHSFQISPDGERAVYLESSGLGGLFSVSLAGGVPSALSEPLPAGGMVTFPFAIDPLTRQVVYRGEQEQDELFEIFRVPLLGGRPRRVNGPMVPTGDTYFFSLARRWVVYTAKQDLHAIELYASPLERLSVR